MGFLYNSKFKKISKINYLSYKIWRLNYLFKVNPFYSKKEKKIFNRSSVIPNFFLKNEILIYNGKVFSKKTITKWSRGFKLGELTWNRKLAIFKKKSIKKK